MRMPMTAVIRAATAISQILRMGWVILISIASLTRACVLSNMLFPFPRGLGVRPREMTRPARGGEESRGRVSSVPRKQCTGYTVYAVHTYGDGCIPGVMALYWADQRKREEKYLDVNRHRVD